MAMKNLREWMKYVEQSTVGETRSDESAEHAPPKTPAEDREITPASRPSPPRSPRRPLSWDTSSPSMRKTETHSSSVTGDILPPQVAEATPSHLPPGEWVGEPRPLVTAKPPPHPARKPVKPVTSPRIRITSPLRFLLEAFPEVALDESVTSGDEKHAHVLEKLVNPELTLRETATVLNTRPSTVRRYANSGILGYRRVGSRYRFRLREVLAFVRRYGKDRKGKRTES